VFSIFISVWIYSHTIYAFMPDDLDDDDDESEEQEENSQEEFPNS
jgi:hypothetical protein